MGCEVSIRRLCLERVDDTKAWFDLGNPCNEQDKELFAGAGVTVEDGEKATFWTSPWLHG
jgi:hypothetical protein